MQSEKSEWKGTVRYAGFGMRMLASLIDIFSTVVLIPIFSIFDKIFDIDAAKIELRGILDDARLNPEAFSVDVLMELAPRLSASLAFQILIVSAVIMAFWMYYCATPGKMLLRMRIVDARTGACPTKSQFLTRAVSSLISAAVFGLGFVWVHYDKRKQGWHDKLARTVVIYK